MGLGKSAQVIAAADILGAKPLLILGPAVGRTQFAREFERFSPRTLNICVLQTAAQRNEIASADVVICSYDLAMRADVFALLSARRWSVLALDEAHFLKSPTARRTLAVMGAGGLVHASDRVWCLTGTPAPLHPGELWVLLYVLGGTRLSHGDFVDRYTTGTDIQVRPGIWSRKITGGKNIQELRALLAPLMLRRKKEDVMPQLPPIRYSEVTVEPSPVDNLKWSVHFDNYLSWGQRARTVFNEDVAKAEKKINVLLDGFGTGADSVKILEGLGGQPEIKSLRRWVGLQKVPAVLEIVAAELDANAYEKIVLFGVHKTVLDELEAGLKRFGAVKIFGGTPPDRRTLAVKKFQNNPKCRVFIGQVIAAGTAITLTAAHHVGVVEADWTPGNNAQAVMRVHRIGQTKPVSARFFCMTGYDEKVTRVLKQRARVLTELFDTSADADSSPAEVQKVEVVDPFSA